jgi:hypothetical protein
VCEFFAVFSRFEFVMKENGFVQRGQDRAHPDWDRFARETASSLRIAPGSDAAAAVEYLSGDPPLVQMRNLSWQMAPLEGQTRVEQALHAVRRVRNNLFHGGKHTPHSPPGRDEKLVQCSRSLIYACLEQDDNLSAAFEQTEF